MLRLNFLSWTLCASLISLACTDNAIHEVGALRSPGSAGSSGDAVAGNTSDIPVQGGNTAGGASGLGGQPMQGGAGGLGGLATGGDGRGSVTLAGGSTSATTIPQPGLNPVTWPSAGVDGQCVPAPRAEVTSVAVAPSGEIYVAGTYAGEANFGTGPLPDLPDLSLFLAKFDVQGNPLWAKAFGGYQADVKVDPEGRPLLAATSILETSSGGKGTLRQLDPLDGHVRWEYPYSWPAGFYAERIAIEAGKQAYLAIPGQISAIDANGQPIWATAIAASGAGQQGHPIELVASASGELTLFMVDYVTWAPFIYQYRLTNYDQNGQQRWTRRLEADINQSLHMAGDRAGRAAIFGSAYGQVNLEGGSAQTLGMTQNYLGISDLQGHVLAQRALDAYSNAAAWHGGKLVMSTWQFVGEVPGSSFKRLETLTFTQFDTTGAAQPLPESNLPALVNPDALIAEQGDHLVIAGTQNRQICLDCLECYQPRPFLMRIDANGVRDTSFGELMP